MGDYNVQIVSAGLKRIDDDKLEDFKKEVEEKAPLMNSAYQATAPFVSVDQWHHRTYLSVMTQFKYNNGAEEFLDWLEPMVEQGMGDDEVWAINYSEWTIVEEGPQIRKLGERGGDD